MVGEFEVLDFVYDVAKRDSRYVVKCGSGHVTERTTTQLSTPCVECTQLDLGGRRMSVAALARIAGITEAGFRLRLKRGLTVAQAILA